MLGEGGAVCGCRSRPPHAACVPATAAHCTALLRLPSTLQAPAADAAEAPAAAEAAAPAEAAPAEQQQQQGGGQPEAAAPAAAAEPQLTEAEKQRLRAARFGLPVAAAGAGGGPKGEPAAAKEGAIGGLGQVDMKVRPGGGGAAAAAAAAPAAPRCCGCARWARQCAALPGSAAGTADRAAPAAAARRRAQEEIERRKKRAERFGMPVPVLKEEVRRGLGRRGRSCAP